MYPKNVAVFSILAALTGATSATPLTQSEPFPPTAPTTSASAAGPTVAFDKFEIDWSFVAPDLAAAAAEKAASISSRAATAAIPVVTADMNKVGGLQSLIIGSTYSALSHYSASGSISFSDISLCIPTSAVGASTFTGTPAMPTAPAEPEAGLESSSKPTIPLLPGLPGMASWIITHAPTVIAPRPTDPPTDSGRAPFSMINGADASSVHRFGNATASNATAPTGENVPTNTTALVNATAPVNVNTTFAMEHTDHAKRANFGEKPKNYLHTSRQLSNSTPGCTEPRLNGYLLVRLDSGHLAIRMTTAEFDRYKMINGNASHLANMTGPNMPALEKRMDIFFGFSWG